MSKLFTATSKAVEGYPRRSKVHAYIHDKRGTGWDGVFLGPRTPGVRIFKKKVFGFEDPFKKKRKEFSPIVE